MKRRKVKESASMPNRIIPQPRARVAVVKLPIHPPKQPDHHLPQAPAPSAMVAARNAAQAHFPIDTTGAVCLNLSILRGQSGSRFIDTTGTVFACFYRYNGDTKPRQYRYDGGSLPPDQILISKNYKKEQRLLQTRLSCSPSKNKGR